MTIQHNRDGDAAELRRQAEEAAREDPSPSPQVEQRPERPPEVDSPGSPLAGRGFEPTEGADPSRSIEETRQLLHELRVHQIELEIQNEELRRTQAELDVSRARYFDLYDLAPVGYCTISASGLILEANLTASRLLGVTRGALVRQRITSFIFSEDEDTYYLHRKRLFQTGEPQTCEVRMVHADGTVFWVLLEAAVERDLSTGPGPAGGDAAACRVVVSDITERKRVEAALIESLQRHTALIEANPDMFFVFTAEGLIVDAKSERADDLYASPDDFLGRRVDEVLPPDLAQRTLDSIAEARRTGRLVRYTYSLELRGESKEFESRLVPCENGTFLAVVRNITERRQAEEALRHTAEVLRQSNEEVRQFAYIVSHDLRAPVVNVGGFVSELRASVADLDRLVRPALAHLEEAEQAGADRILRQDIPEALEFIGSSVVRMDNLINALLRLSRLGHRGLILERLDLGALVAEILGSLGMQIAERAATVTVLPLPEITADRTTMEQILSNILANAVLYLDPARPGRIEVSGKLVGTDLRVRVSDNGRGIAPEDRDKVFAPFRRAGAPEVPGEGMGLASVQALVRRQGGRVWFESEPGVGTTFSFVLPVVSREAQ